MQPVYLVCGVPGSGKTWVCERLQDNKFAYVPHDRYRQDITLHLVIASRSGKLPVVSECPFGERELRDRLEQCGIRVVPVFVVESPRVVRERYVAREGREPHQSALTRASTIQNRADEWGAFSGSSAEVLKHLQNI